MVLANAGTSVDANKTVGELQTLLARAGAKALLVEYAGSEPVALSFKIELRAGGHAISFRLPCNWEGVFKVLKNDRTVPQRLKTIEQARRVGWRIIREWLRAQLSLIAAGAANLEEVMLPWAITYTEQGGQSTVSHDLLTGRSNLLGLPAPKVE